MHLQYNPDIQRLSSPVTITGGKVDTFSDVTGSITISENPSKGIVFRAGGCEIPYTNRNVQCTDGIAGRMLYVEDDAKQVRVYLVEHIISALGALGLYNVIIDVGESCHAPTFSLFSRAGKSIFDRQIRSYCVPIPGPGVKGFTDALSASVTQDESSQGFRRVIRCTHCAVFRVVDENYNGIERSLKVSPSDHFEVVIESSYHPDAGSVIPEHDGITLRDSDDLSIHADARPVARVTSRIKYFLLRTLMRGSEAITPKTYFMATPGDTQESLVEKMHPRYQDGRNEHLYHTATSDLIAELVQIFGDAILKMKITISDSNHRFRLNALKQLQDEGAFERVTLEG